MPFFAILRKKRNAMKRCIDLLAVFAALLLLTPSCSDLFKPQEPDIPYDGAIDVLLAHEHVGEDGVWVQGYIVGVASSSKKFCLEEPFPKSSNLVLGDSDTTTVREHLLSVQLPSGRIRTGLNLQDHPELLGRKVYIKGNLVSAYYGIPGLKSPSEYGFDD